MTTLAKLRLVLRDLAGKLCFSVIYGGPEQALVLDLGTKRPRALRLANRRLSFVQRSFEGSAGLYVDCAWALDGPRGRVITSLETSEGDGPPLIGVLEGDKVDRITLPAPGLDPVLWFRSGHVLRVLSTRVDGRGRLDNWAIWSERGSYALGPGGRISGPPAQKPGEDGDLVEAWRARWRATGRKVPEEE